MKILPILEPLSNVSLLCFIAYVEKIIFIHFPITFFVFPQILRKKNTFNKIGRFHPKIPFRSLFGWWKSTAILSSFCCFFCQILSLPSLYSSHRKQWWRCYFKCRCNSILQSNKKKDNDLETVCKSNFIYWQNLCLDLCSLSSIVCFHYVLTIDKS